MVKRSRSPKEEVKSDKMNMTKKVAKAKVIFLKVKPEETVKNVIYYMLSAIKVMGKVGRRMRSRIEWEG